MLTGDNDGLGDDVSIDTIDGLEVEDIDTTTASVVDLSPRPPMRSLTFWMTSSNLVSSVLSIGYRGVDATPAPKMKSLHTRKYFSVHSLLL